MSRPPLLRSVPTTSSTATSAISLSPISYHRTCTFPRRVPQAELGLDDLQFVSGTGVLVRNVVHAWSKGAYVLGSLAGAAVALDSCLDFQVGEPY